MEEVTMFALFVSVVRFWIPEREWYCSNSWTKVWSKKSVVVSAQARRLKKYVCLHPFMFDSRSELCRLMSTMRPRVKKVNQNTVLSRYFTCDCSVMRQATSSLLQWLEFVWAEDISETCVVMSWISSTYNENCASAILFVALVCPL